MKKTHSDDYNQEDDSFFQQLKDLVENWNIDGFSQDKALLQQAQKTPLTKEMILRIAVLMGNEDAVKQSLVDGADPNYQVKGSTVYQLAQAFNLPNIESLLEGFGAKLPAKNSLKN